jgi:uncharacterized protein YoxC
MVIQISAGILTLALCILIAALVRTLREANKALEKIGKLTDETRIQLNALSGEVRETIQGVNDVTYDVRLKMAEVHSAFETVGEIGRLAASTTFTVRQTAASVSKTIKEKLTDRKSPVQQSKATAWLSAAAGIVRAYRNAKRSDQTEPAHITART